MFWSGLLCLSCPLALLPAELRPSSPPTWLQRFLGTWKGLCPRCGGSPQKTGNWLAWHSVRRIQGGSALIATLPDPPAPSAPTPPATAPPPGQPQEPVPAQAEAPPEAPEPHQEPAQEPPLPELPPIDPDWLLVPLVGAEEVLD